MNCCACAVPVARNSAAIPVRSNCFISYLDGCRSYRAHPLARHALQSKATAIRPYHVRVHPRLDGAIASGIRRAACATPAVVVETTLGSALVAFVSFLIQIPWYVPTVRPIVGALYFDSIGCCRRQCQNRRCKYELHHFSLTSFQGFFPELF